VAREREKETKKTLNISNILISFLYLYTINFSMYKKK